MAASIQDRSVDARRHPRFDLYASVEFRDVEEILILSVRDISVGGVALDTDGHTLPRMPIGSSHELAIFDPTNPAHHAIVIGQVVRQAPGVIALTWSEEASAVAEVAKVVMTFVPRR